MLRGGTLPSVIARVEPAECEHNDEELRINVPCWMLQQRECDRVVLNKNLARIEIDALIRLRAIVDSGLIVAIGDCHESTTSTNADQVTDEAKDV